MIDVSVATWTVLAFSLTSLLVGYIGGRLRNEITVEQLDHARRQLVWLRRERDEARAARAACCSDLRRHGISGRHRHLHSVR
jgi:hypothetical protein